MTNAFRYCNSWPEIVGLVMAAMASTGRRRRFHCADSVRVGVERRSGQQEVPSTFGRGASHCAVVSPECNFVFVHDQLGALEDGTSVGVRESSFVNTCESSVWRRCLKLQGRSPYSLAIGRHVPSCPRNPGACDSPESVQFSSSDGPVYFSERGTPSAISPKAA
jgi:hypothetical protein